jgi:hypothetical protein
MDAAAGISAGIHTGALAIARDALPLIAGSLGARIEARYGRKVLRFKDGELETEARTVQEIDALKLTKKRTKSSL